jgi:hypothetical protein
MPILDRGGHFAMMKPVCSYCIAATLKDPSKLPKNMYITAEEPTRSLRTGKGPNGEELLIVCGNGHSLGDKSGLQNVKQYQVGMNELKTTHGIFLEFSV